MIVAFIFFYFLLLLILLSVNDFPNPTGIKYIIFSTLFCYLYGVFVLKHTRHRRHFYSSVILYSYFFYLYGRYYYLSSHLLLKLTFLLYLVRAIVSSTNKFSFEFDSMQMQLEQGLGDFVAANIITYMKQDYERELLADLNQEILFIRRKHRHEKMK